MPGETGKRGFGFARGRKGIGIRPRRSSRFDRRVFPDQIPFAALVSFRRFQLVVVKTYVHKFEAVFVCCQREFISGCRYVVFRSRQIAFRLPFLRFRAAALDMQRMGTGKAVGYQYAVGNVFLHVGTQVKVAGTGKVADKKFRGTVRR